MRIISGSLRSRRFEAPRGEKTRPTSDRLRETLFNVLAPRIEGAAFLDLYAGSGAVGMEALSRGAARVVFVERAAPAVKVLRGNLAGLGLKEGVEVRAESVGTFLRNLPAAHLSGKDRDAAKVGHPLAVGVGNPEFDIVYLDPPYDAEGEYETALGLLGGDSAGLLHPDALVIAEHRRKDVLKDGYGALKRSRLLRQGDAALSFYVLVSQQVGE